MKILSVETSSPICSVSILEDVNVIYEKTIENSLSHSENLMPIIKTAFDETNLSLQDINLFACSKGPGSFTGIRIGISTIKAFVDVFETPAIGISSLEGLAYNVEDSEFVCSIINAKNNNCYSALFKKVNEAYVLIDKFLSDSIQNIMEILRKFKNEPITFVGDGIAEFKSIILENFSNPKFCLNKTCNSVSIGIAALKHYNNDLNFDDSLAPMYLKKSQAERQLEEGKLK